MAGPDAADSQTPSLGEVQRNAILTALGRVYTSLPGIVQSYDASTKTAEVTLALRQPALLADGTYELRDLPALAAVPVKFPRGGGYSLEFPLVKGDGVLVVFTMYPHDAFRQQGQVADPDDVRSHSLAGAVALAGFETVAQAASHPGPDHLVLGKDGGPAIHIDTLIRLGDAAASDFVALSSKVDANFAAIKAAVAATTPAGPETGYAALKVAFAVPGFLPPTPATKATAV